MTWSDEELRRMGREVSDPESAGAWLAALHEAGALVLPVQRVGRVWHVSRGRGRSRRRSGVDERIGLLVTEDPEEWARVARLGDARTRGFARKDGRRGAFLDVLGLKNDYPGTHRRRGTRKTLADAAVRAGLVERRRIYRASWHDGEDGVTRYTFFERRAEAEEEVADLDEDHGLVEEVDGLVPTALLRSIWLARWDDELALLSAEEVAWQVVLERAGFLDGLWWDEQGVTRGSIFPSKVREWRRSPRGRHGRLGRRNPGRDEPLRGLERRALAGDEDAAREWISAVLESGDVRALRAAARRLGAPPGEDAKAIRRRFGLQPRSVDLLVEWRDLVHHFQAEDHLVWFDGRSWNSPDWIAVQADEDSDKWIEDRESRTGRRLKESRRRAVRDLVFQAVERGFLAERHMTADVLRREVAAPINGVAAGGLRYEHAGIYSRRLPSSGTAIEVVGVGRDGATFRLHEPFLAAYVDLRHSYDGSTDEDRIELDEVRPSMIIEMLDWMYSTGELGARPELPHVPSWDYESPDPGELDAAVRESAPKRKGRRGR